MAGLNVISICGSLRKGSYNAIVQRALPSLAPDGMSITPAPAFTEFPLYKLNKPEIFIGNCGVKASRNTIALAEAEGGAGKPYLAWRPQSGYRRPDPR